MAYDYSRSVRAEVGVRHVIECPYSEVCMHMRVSGMQMLAELLLSSWGCSVQLYHLDGRSFSSPILTGEAGFFQDLHGYYFYPPAHPVRSGLTDSESDSGCLIPVAAHAAVA